MQSLEISLKVRYPIGMFGGRTTSKIISKSVKETQKVAKILVGELVRHRMPSKRAVVIALEGSLGSGKTTFAQGFAKALGIKEKVLSPTFVLVKIYPVREKHRLNFPNGLLAKKMRLISQRHLAFLSNGVNSVKKFKRFKHLVHIDCYRL